MITTKRKAQLILIICISAGLIFLMFRCTVYNENLLPVPRILRNSGNPVLVMVFYEALCPDSKHFITKQLLPAYRTAPALMDIVLIPYGKATTSTKADGSFRFDCQHGPLECQSNIYHACAIEIIKEKEKQLNVISCMLKDNRLPKAALKKCTDEYKVESLDLIQKCYNSPHGIDLLKFNGDLTKALRPTISFIPTVTLDGSQGKQAVILKNLLAEICKVVVGNVKPKNICTNI